MVFYDSVNSPTPLAPLLSHPNTRKDHVVYQTRGNLKKITELSWTCCSPSVLFNRDEATK